MAYHGYQWFYNRLASVYDGLPVVFQWYAKPIHLEYSPASLFIHITSHKSTGYQFYPHGSYSRILFP